MENEVEDEPEANVGAMPIIVACIAMGIAGFLFVQLKATKKSLAATNSEHAAIQESLEAANTELNALRKQVATVESHLRTSVVVAGRAARDAANQGFFREAEKRAVDAEQLAPDGPWGPFARGSIALARNDREAAKAHFEQALARDDGHGPSIAALAKVNAELGTLENVRESIQDLSTFTEWQSLAAAGDALRKLRDFANARKAYDAALDMMAEDMPERDAILAARGEANAWVESEGFYECVRELPVAEQFDRLKTKLREIHSVDGKYRLEFEAGESGMDELVIYHSPIRFLQPLKDFPLRALKLDDTRVDSLEPLRGMPLERLEVEESEISDLSPLTGMPLRSVTIIHSPITDLAPLSGAGLEKLDVRSTQVSDLAPLSGMPLKIFNCGHSKVRDLMPLADCPIENLSINNNGLGDIRAVAGFDKLRRFNMYGTEVRDLSPLAELNITDLNISANGITDLSPLKNLKLTRIEIAYDKYLEDMTPLEGLPLKEIVAPKNESLSDASREMLANMQAAGCLVRFR